MAWSLLEIMPHSLLSVSCSIPRTVGLKGTRFLSSGGAQAFQLATEHIGPEKLTFSIEWGMLAVFVQSQRRQRFLITILQVVVLFFRDGKVKAIF